MVKIDGDKIVIEFRHNRSAPFKVEIIPDFFNDIIQINGVKISVDMFEYLGNAPPVLDAPYCQIANRGGVITVHQTTVTQRKIEEVEERLAKERHERLARQIAEEDGSPEAEERFH